MGAVAKETGGNLAGKQVGRYEILTQIAAGGMAAVYIARAKGVAGFERLVAIKVLHPHLAYEPEFVSMFLDEARLAARIRHPHVVPTLDISDSGTDGYFLVMEFVEGDHLGALLSCAAKQGKRIPTSVTARIIGDALAGLGAAHRLTDEDGDPLSLVHRDVSPHNIMVGSDGVSRLTDFGVAKAEKRLTSTRTGQLKGKLAYMAPEQASKGEADRRSDLFSMGIVLWEALIGRRLFRGTNNAETLNMVLNKEVEAPSSLWPDLEPFDELISKALSRDPDARFQNAEAFGEALELASREHAAGLATRRQVSKEVEHWLGEAVQAQRKKIRDAIANLGSGEYSEEAIPLPADPSQSEVTLSARPREDEQISITLEEEPRHSRKWLLVAPLVIGIVAMTVMLSGIFDSEETVVLETDEPEHGAEPEEPDSEQIEPPLPAASNANNTASSETTQEPQQASPELEVDQDSEASGNPPSAVDTRRRAERRRAREERRRAEEAAQEAAEAAAREAAAREAAAQEAASMSSMARFANPYE